MKRKLKRKTAFLLMAAATGAALAYLFDPARGEQRRERLSRRIADATADVASARRQMADTVEEVAAAAGSDAGSDAVDTTVTDALAAEEPLPDIGGVTTPSPDAASPSEPSPGDRLG